MRGPPILALALGACAPGGAGWDASNPPACDARALGAGEVRARHIWCNGELVSGGDGRVGDWMLENAAARFAIRGDYAPLTRHHGAGGTLVDAIPLGGQDAVTELTPLFDGLWFETLDITAWNLEDEAGLDLVGALADGTEATLTWSLRADEPTLRWSGASDALLVPPAGSQVTGALVEAAADALDPGEATVLGLDGAPSDAGGWLRYSDVQAVSVGDAERVSEALWPTGVAVSGLAEGLFVEVFNEDTLPAARFPVRDGAFSGVVPVTARALRATAPGYADGPSSAPSRDLALSLGARGTIRARVADQDGRDLPATLWFDGEPWPLPAGGGDAPVGPGAGEAWLSAGPAYEARDLGVIEVSEVVSVEAVLRRVAPDAVLAELGLTGWPDPSERRRAADLSASAASRGVGYAVLAADDEVAPAAVEGHDSEWILVSGGARPVSEAVGPVLAWPWSANSRQPAHGAPELDLLDPATMVDLVEMGAGRLALVSPGWLEAAGPPEAWSRDPHGVILGDLTQLAPWFEALDGWRAVAATGPLTWLSGLRVAGSSAVDASAAIVASRTVASNGPSASLTVDGQGPGGQVSAMALHTLHLEIQAPAWLPLTIAAIYITGGALLGSWPMHEEDGTRLDLTLRAPLPTGWVLAAAWGDRANPPLQDAPAWVITSPVWVGRP